MGGERLRQAVSLAVFALAGACEVFALPAAPSVLGLGILLLGASDKGQHRALADQNPSRPRAGVIGLSIGAHYGLNVIALLASYAAGRFTAMFHGIGEP